jgi:hypothetical protein
MPEPDTDALVAIHALEGGLVHSYSCAMLDWEALREALQTALLEAVSAEVGGRWRAAALGELYAETDSVIEAPSLFLNDDGEDMDSPGNWETVLHNWAPELWIKALTAEACSGTVSHWEDIFARYRDVLVRICVAAGARLGMPVFCVDHDCYEETLARCLTPSQLRSLFPKVVARQAERARVSALPPGEQIAYYVSRLNRFDGLIDSEEAQDALRGFGSAAIPALLPLLREREHAWLAAMLLAEIGVPDDTVISALSAALAASTPDSPGQLWSCMALAQLDRLDLVLAGTSDLSSEALATAVTARYTAFRDHGAHPLSLDYLPLEEFLSEHEAIAAAVANALKPGTSYCVISAAEVPEALRGTTSTHVLVRKHAVCVLGERRLGDAVGRAVIPQLRAIAETDHDSEVRRLAALSLKWWKADR